MPPSATHHAGSAAGPTDAQQLWDAASVGDVSLVQQLSWAEDSELETRCSSSASAVSSSSSSPLHAAACAGHGACVTALLTAGAVVDTVNTAGASAFACAASRGHISVMVMLGQLGAKVEKAHEPPPRAALVSVAAQACAATGAYITSPEPGEDESSGGRLTNPPVDSIMAACEHGDLKVLQVMTHFAANVNRAYDNGDTGLHVSVENNRIDLADELLRRGALVSSKNLQGLTPLHVAVMREESSKTQQLVELLLHYHGAVTLEDGPGDGGVASVHSTAELYGNHTTAAMMHAKTSAALARRKADVAEVRRRVENGPEDVADLRDYFVETMTPVLRRYLLEPTTGERAGDLDTHPVHPV